MYNFLTSTNNKTKQYHLNTLIQAKTLRQGGPGTPQYLPGVEQIVPYSPLLLGYGLSPLVHLFVISVQ